jgi:pimeloyl-ACP methyl ester carboxylesterase
MSQSSVYRSGSGETVVRRWCERRLTSWATPHERREIDTSLGRTHLVIAGRGQKEAILYLPGTNMNAATSRSLASELAARAQLVLVDLPGQPGLSSGMRPAGPRMDAYGAWVGEVIEYVRRWSGARTLTLVGHSLGGAVALAAPTADVAAIVLVDPAGFAPVRVSPAVLLSTLSWLLIPSGRTSSGLLRHMLAADRRPQPTLVEWMSLVARHTRPAGAPGPLAVGVTSRWRQTPRAVLSGQRDCFLDPVGLGRAVEERFGVPLKVLPGLGHLSVEDDPVGLSSAILRTLRRTSFSAAAPTGSSER